MKPGKTRNILHRYIYINNFQCNDMQKIQVLAFKSVFIGTVDNMSTN